MNSNKIKIEISMEVMERVVIQLIFSRMILTPSPSQCDGDGVNIIPPTLGWGG